MVKPTNLETVARNKVSGIWNSRHCIQIAGFAISLVSEFSLYSAVNDIEMVVRSVGSLLLPYSNRILLSKLIVNI